MYALGKLTQQHGMDALSPIGSAKLGGGMFWGVNTLANVSGRLISEGGIGEGGKGLVRLD